MIAVSPDPVVGRILLDALGTIGPVELKSSLEAVGTSELSAPLCAIHFSGSVAQSARDRVPRLTGGCRVIAILPRSDLGAIVELMQSSTRFVGVMVEEELDPRQFVAMARRVIEDRVFGIDAMLAPGAEILEWTVTEDVEKVACLGAIAAELERREVMRVYREPIEQCVDEMVTNALYDAPLAKDGLPAFAQIKPQVRILLRTEYAVTVRFAFDGARVVISVRDRFGSLDRRTVIRYLDKCLHAALPVDRKFGGGGVGLYLMVNAAAGVDFLLLPGFSTEVVCSFEVQAPPRGLAHFGVYVQRDATGELAAGPARVLRSAVVRRRQVVRAAAIVVLVALAVGIGLSARLLRKQRPAVIAAIVQVDAGPQVATIELESKPPGATVLVDGKPAGETPLALTSLAPGATAEVTFKLEGYADVVATAHAPAIGATNHLARNLVRSDDYVTVHVLSTPPGAEILEPGELSGGGRTYTPADLVVRADKQLEFTLRMPDHVPVLVARFLPGHGGETIEISRTLAPGSTLHVDSKQGGSASVVGAPHCQHQEIPFDCVLAPGAYQIELVDRNHTKVTHTLVVGRTGTSQLY